MNDENELKRTLHKLEAEAMVHKVFIARILSLLALLSGDQKSVLEDFGSAATGLIHSTEQAMGENLTPGMLGISVAMQTEADWIVDAARRILAAGEAH